MYCVKCGQELLPTDKFCDHCGEPVKPADANETASAPPKAPERGADAGPAPPKAAPPKASKAVLPETDLKAQAASQAAPQTASEKKKRSRGKTVATVVIVLAVLAALGAGVFYVLSHMEDPKVREFLELGERYLLDENYEEAIIAYESALEIDEKCVDAYLGMADAYIGLGETEKAVSALRNGYRLTNDKTLDERLREIRSAVANAEDLTIDIVQVDSSAFPEMTLFAQITDRDGRAIDSLPREIFVVSEIDDRGKKHHQPIDEMQQILDSDGWNMNMVLDQSGSMADYDKMGQAISAAHIFLREVMELESNRIEIASFDDNVYLRQEFTDDYDALANAIDALEPMGGTALYDAIYSALLRTSDLLGARCVVVFTDGMENSSQYGYDDVIRLSTLAGIPVYVIGIGHDIDETSLRNIASGTGGRYYNAAAEDLRAALSEIYLDIYEYQRSMYAVKYTSSFADLRDKFRTIELKSKPTDGYAGTAGREYTPNASESIEDEKSAAEDLIIVAPPKPVYAQPIFDYISASSVRNAYKDITYVAENAIDGDTNTAWVEGAAGAGIGEWIEFSANRPQTVTEIRIMNGYFKSEDLYYKNNSIRRLLISADGISMESTLLQDPGGEQVISFAQPIETTTLRLTILDVYAGNADFEDTCISEISIF
jgi:VWFA-related protein